MKFRRPREEEPRLGITPLIDIVFLLLIFFMLTSHFDMASGVHVKLPKVAQKLFTSEDSKVTVVIDSGGRIFLKGEKLNQEDLAARFQTLVEEGSLVDLILQADKEVKHGKVVQVMDLAKSSGVQSIIIAARWDADRVH